jgi:hypothetical protein
MGGKIILVISWLIDASRDPAKPGYSRSERDDDLSGPDRWPISWVAVCSGACGAA